MRVASQRKPKNVQRSYHHCAFPPSLPHCFQILSLVLLREAEALPVVIEVPTRSTSL